MNTTQTPPKVAAKLITQKKPGTKKVYWKVLKAAVDPSRPLLAQIVITKRCNLSCGYCFEYDKVSKPIDFEVLKRRIDEFKRLLLPAIIQSEIFRRK